MAQDNNPLSSQVLMTTTKRKHCAIAERLVLIQAKWHVFFIVCHWEMCFSSTALGLLRNAVWRSLSVTHSSIESSLFSHSVYCPCHVSFQLITFLLRFVICVRHRGKHWKFHWNVGCIVWCLDQHLSASALAGFPLWPESSTERAITHVLSL